jgi:hypothetical protein
VANITEECLSERATSGVLETIALVGGGLADRVICASAYLIPFACNHLLGPRFKHRWNRS